LLIGQNPAPSSAQDRQERIVSCRSDCRHRASAIFLFARGATTSDIVAQMNKPLISSNTPWLEDIGSLQQWRRDLFRHSGALTAALLLNSALAFVVLLLL
jgi:hypothetical protein